MLVALEAEAAALGGGRERSVRDLAALVPAPELVPVTPIAPAPETDATGATNAATMNLRADRATEGPSIAASIAETYFRDKRSATFVDEVLGTPTPPAPARRRAPLALVLGLVVAAGAGAGTVALMRRTTHTPVAAPSVASPPTPPRALALPAPSPPAPETAAPPAPPSAPPTRRRAAAKRSAPVEMGQLVIQCTPWCVPYVDREARGKDGRNFPIALPLGPHVVEVKRLDDHQRRDVRVVAGDAQVLKFTFE
jgi:hypothetical protein